VPTFIPPDIIPVGNSRREPSRSKLTARLRSPSRKSEVPRDLIKKQKPKKEVKILMSKSPQKTQEDPPRYEEEDPLHKSLVPNSSLSLSKGDTLNKRLKE